jgi:hypothetical protein
MLKSPVFASANSKVRDPAVAQDSGRGQGVAAVAPVTASPDHEERM